MRALSCCIGLSAASSSLTAGSLILLATSIHPAGEDQLPMQRQAGGAGASNPAGPASGANASALHGLSGIKVGVWSTQSFNKAG